MQQFHITLRNDKIKLYNRFSWLVLIILTLVFIYFIFSAKGYLRRTEGIIFLVTLSLAFLLKLYFEETKFRFGIEALYYLVAMGFIANGQYLLGGVAILFQFLYIISVRKKVVLFFTDKILFPSFPARSIQWKSLNNSLLKDGLLTIDFKNDKVIQQLIDESKTSVDEKEFNEFCKQQLIISNQKPAT